jgi:hypothetical protein
MTISFDRASELMTKTSALSLINAGGIGLLATLALGRVSPSKLTSIAQRVLSPLSPCKTSLFNRVNRIEQFASSVRD